MAPCYSQGISKGHSEGMPKGHTEGMSKGHAEDMSKGILPASYIVPKAVL